MPNRNRKTAFYNHESGDWNVYYTQKDGTIKIDPKIKTHKQALAAVKKNKNYNPQTDKIPKVTKTKKGKKSEKSSIVESTRINNTVRLQKEINRDLKNINKLFPGKKVELWDKINTINYKRQEFSKKVKKDKYVSSQIKSRTGGVIKEKADMTFFFTSKPQLWMKPDSFDRIKTKLGKPALRDYDRYMVKVGDMEGSLSKADFKNKTSFEKAMSRIVADRGKRGYTRLTDRPEDDFNFEIKGIKR